MEDRPNERYNEAEAYGATKASKFRLKSDSTSKTSKRHHRGEEEKNKREARSTKRHRSEERSPSRRTHRDSKRRHKNHSYGNSVHDYTFARSGEYQDPENRHRESLFDGLDDQGQAIPEANSIHPEDAFRESLFDALADDEGAAYWEGVYGQPIHVYSNTKKGLDGTLERMSDEEYAEYVRAKMWEKSHEHIVQEREARAKQRQNQNQQRRKMEDEAGNMEEERREIRKQMRESLKRGEERKRAKELEAAWGRYVEKWERLKGYKDLAQETAARVQETIPWPVVSGRWESVSKDAIECFFENSSAWKDDAAAMLKVERVRWHPDKMQQRFGQHIDLETMKSVTAVFQVVDRLWNERRK
ncbi:hypothetical protein K505DRAFT_325139 [Melanomma pulvis-pyrius CBS 109.77]|uniref:Uncharacterized protein n=1 Tax=Melanomma pulvis-pyrius CBS 109.77 TaxID=1314802 RepID=A0A6A6XBU1_9PLEO|nr:hypothetical protein K505DRAFT_325139 [Melanomma pulvis-pyrius CBS 109.77]